MDIINATFTFGIPGLVIYSIASNYIKNKKQLAERETTKESVAIAEDPPNTLQPVKAAQPTAQPVRMPSKTMTLERVVTYINDKRDDVPHWFCKGGTGSGKSTFIRLALAYRVARGEQFVIMTGKRTSVFADVPCIGRDALADGQWKITYKEVQRMCRLLLAELLRRDHIPNEQRAFSVINIVLDDASLILSEVEEAHTLFRNVGLLGRELDMRLIVATGSTLVKELGLEGKSDLRDHFAVITYNKRVDGTRETLLRPRYDDATNLPFDAARVPGLSMQSYIDKTRVWKPVKSQDDVLRELNESWDDDSAIVIHDEDGDFEPFSARNKRNKGNNDAADHADSSALEAGNDSVMQFGGISNDINLRRYLEVMQLLLHGNLSQNDIAMHVGVSASTVNQISKALKRG